MSRWLRNVFLIVVVVGVCLGIGACAILSQDKFGRQPDGKRLANLQTSPNFKDGEFQNTVSTPMLVDGQSTLKILWDNLLADHERLRPKGPLPTIRLDLKNPNTLAGQDTVIWLGHSSYFIQLGGLRILVDPVFSDQGSPFPFANTIFPGTDVYTAEDMPEIDYLIISHDHWDHLDHATVVGLMPKVKTVICPLGVATHFEHWGYPQERLREADWDTVLRFENKFTIYVTPARHYSGRGFTKNKSLWAGFVLETPERRIFLSGDTGYGPHFADIARTFGGFDLVALDGGQYDPRWPLIHMTPEQAVRVAEELRAKSMLLAHVGRFSIASHPWDEPFIRVSEVAKDADFALLTPKIGEPVRLDGTGQRFVRWWEGID
jgi:L-ascorbate metabolism protein UlaG (beta-lactamase superfamily)